jgi:protein TonB
MRSLRLTEAYNAHRTHQFSPSGIVVIVAAHAAVLALLASLNVVPLPTPLAALMVQIITAAPPAPEIMPPRPQPVERKPVVRPQPTPQPIPRQPVLAAQTEAPSLAAEVPLVRETPLPAPPAPAAPTTISQPRFDADYLLNPAPVYPALARRMGEEGRVVLRVFVEPAGRPSQIEVKTGSGSPRLDQAAQDAVWRWKFVPARRGFDAVGAWVLVPIVFNLRN